MRNIPSFEEIYAFMFHSLRYFGLVSPELEEAIKASTRIRLFDKGKVILKKGAVCRHCYFSFFGTVRGYFDTPRKEVTEWFMHRGDIFIWPTSFFNQVPSIGTIQALQDMVTVELSFEDYKWLKDNFPDFRNIDDVATKYYYGLTYERIEMKGYTATENYQRLIAKHPDIVDIAGVKVVASYLGINEGSLSRIRGILKNSQM